MQMFVKRLQTDAFTITAELENGQELVSFERCFLINTPEILPKAFKIRDDRVHTKVKLTSYENVLHKVTCSGKVRFRDLAKFLPTVFNLKEVKAINERVFVKENFRRIVELSKDILEEDEVVAMLESKLRGV